MIILDPESQTAVTSDDRIIYNCSDKDLVSVDRNVLTCEWCDDNPDHNQLLLLAELYFGRKYPRFIDFYQVIMRDDTIYLREWEKLRTTIKDKDFDYHQQLGNKRAVTMKLAALTFIKMIKEKRTLSLSAGLSRIMRMNPTIFQLPIDMTIDYSKAKNSFFEIYKKLADCPNWEILNDLVLKKTTERGYVQNYWGRRLRLGGEPTHIRIPKATEGKTNTIAGWLIHSSVHDTAIYTSTYLSKVLKPYGGNAYPGYQCVNVLLGNAPYKMNEILDFASNPDDIFENKLEVTNV